MSFVIVVLFCVFVLDRVYFTNWDGPFQSTQTESITSIDLPIVAVWSGVNIAGVRLNELNPEIGSEKDTEKWSELHKQVVQSAYEVIKLKGYTSWAIGLSVSNIAAAILRNTCSVHAISTHVKGFHGIEEDVFLSLPVLLGENGVSHIVNQPLTPHEKAKLQESAKVMDGVQSGLKF